MRDDDVELRVPDECADWCRAQDYSLVVADDMARIDLDWWNQRLYDSDVPVQLRGRNADGEPIVTTGKAFLRRDDLAPGVLPDDGHPELGVLYRAAAWLHGHPGRARAKRFLDVSRPTQAGQSFAAITRGLRLCENGRIFSGGWRDNAPWPYTPGVGPALLSLYCWAVHEPGYKRPQLLDQHSLSTLCYLGWLETPSLPSFTRSRYLRYCELLHRWSLDIQVPAELIEMWLAGNWQERISQAGRRVVTDLP